jgi:4-hydroxy-tetrahydrodipicolinate synthase
VKNAAIIDRLQGSFPPLVTPFEGGAVDAVAFQKLVGHVVDGGSHGLVVNGTTAEPTSLSVAERNQMVELAVATASGRVPVVAATGAHNYEETLALTKAAEQAGADALMIVTPYFIKPPVRGLVEYYTTLAAQTDLPVLIYHIPGRAAVSLPADAVAEIAARASNLVGIKHASTDLAYVTELLARLGPEFRVFVGLEELSFPMMAIGACGLMNAAGNLMPGPVAQLADAVLAGDMATARRLHFELFDINQAIFWDTNPIPMKYMMKRLGVLPDNTHRLPMMAATPALEQRLDALLAKAGLAAA